MEDARALAPFVEAVAKTTEKRVVCDIILKVINHPDIFVFGELLDAPHVMELEAIPECKQYWNLLRLFAYGTYSEAQAHLSNFPVLTPPQISKLRMLTLVALANKQKIIPYDMLVRELAIDNVRQIEDMVIECTYKGLIRAKMDQKNQRLSIQFAIGRDVPSDQIAPMLSTLQQWVHASEEFLTKIDEQLKTVEGAREAKAKHEKDFRLASEERRTQVRLQMEQEEMSRQQQGLQAMAGMAGMAGMMGMGGMDGYGMLDDALDDDRRRGRRGHR